MATLTDLPDGALPRELVSLINRAAQDQSVVARLAGDPIPMGHGETSFLFSTEEPEVQPVGEAKPKPVSDVGYGVRTITPQKFATIVTVSEEFAHANIDGVYDRIVAQLSAAAARGLDLAILHGRNAATGEAFNTGNSGYVNETTNEVVLGTGEDITADLLAGYEMVTAGEHDFTGFAFDPQFRPVLVTSRDNAGNPTYQSSIDLSSSMDTLLGLPVAYGRTVSGRSRNAAAEDTGVRGLAGDWSQVRYGFADRIRIKTSDTATINGTSMFQTNQIAILVEFIMGWVVLDTDAFVRYTNGDAVS